MAVKTRVLVLDVPPGSLSRISRRIVVRRPIGHQTRVVATAMAILTVLAGQTTYGYNQEFPPDGNPNTIGTCTGSGVSICIRWKKAAGGLSITADGYLFDSLEDEEINLKNDIRDAWDEYNALPANNPFINGTTSSGSAEVKYRTADLELSTAYAGTTWTLEDTSPYRIVGAVVKFNTLIVWNRSLNFDCYPDSDPPEFVECKADIRKVANHEQGHVEGLAHEGSPTVAVMRSGPLTYYHVQTDDSNGIVSIYGAYP